MLHLIAVGTYIQTHLFAIILAIAATYVIGFIWHGPLFGKQWMAYNKMTPPKKEDMKFSMMLPGLSANFVMVFVQAAILGRALELVALGGIGDALIIATILSVPFTGLAIVNSYAWEGKKPGHMLLDASFYLVSLWAVAAVLYVMR